MYSRAIWLPASVSEGWKTRVAELAKTQRDLLDEEEVANKSAAISEETEETKAPEIETPPEPENDENIVSEWLEDGDSSASSDGEEGKDSSESGGSARIKREDFDNEEAYLDAIMEGYENDDELEFMARLGGDATMAKETTELLDASAAAEASDSEDEDLVIQAWDGLFVTLGSGDASDEVHCVTLHTFDTALRSMFVHHEIYVEEFPLCCAHIAEPNLVAVGTKNESIEVFDMDLTSTMQTVAPLCQLGGRTLLDDSDSLAASKELREYYSLNPSKAAAMPEEERDLIYGVLKGESHTGAVLCLDWHCLAKERLLSGSEDSTVKQWDLHKLCCVRTLDGLHTGEVQALASHGAECNVVLSGSYDGTVRLFDCRDESHGRVWTVGAEVEAVKWNGSWDERQFIAALDNGTVACFDVRKGSDALWQLQAHEKAVTDFAVNKRWKRMIATVSLDARIKLWDLNEIGGKAPAALIAQQSSNQMNAVFSCDFGEDRLSLGSLLIMAGEKDFGLWDVATSEAVKEWIAKNY